MRLLSESTIDSETQLVTADYHETLSKDQQCVLCTEYRSEATTSLFGHFSKSRLSKFKIRGGFLSLTRVKDGERHWQNRGDERAEIGYEVEHKRRDPKDVCHLQSQNPEY